MSPSATSAQTQLSFFQKLGNESRMLRRFLWKYRRATFAGVAALTLVNVLSILPPLLLKRAVDGMVSDPQGTRIWEVALFFLASLIGMALGRYFWRVFLVYSSIRAARDLREELAGHLIRLAPSFFDRMRIGELMALQNSDVEGVKQGLGPGLIVLADALFFFLTVPVAMWMLSPELTLLTMIPLPFVPFIVIFCERQIHARYRKVQEQFSQLSALAQEILSGIRVIKGFANEDVQLRRFESEGQTYVSLNTGLNRVQSAFSPALDLVLSLAMACLLYWGGKHVIEQQVSVGTFIAFQRYLQMMVWPVAAIGMAVTHYQRAVTSSSRLEEILSVRTDVPESQAASVPKTLRPGRVRIEGLRFSHGEREVLRGISLQIEPGERVAFMGQIGCGKSTLLSLLPRLYPVVRGMLFVDDLDVADWKLEALRRHIAFVGQDHFLFSDTVLENLAIGFQERGLRLESLEQAREVTERASVHADLSSLPAGYQTLLGERGVNLSGGQKQRLSIARALAKQAPILILDDALSSVDTETEAAILSGLETGGERPTVLIAAHRLSTARAADRIVILENGRMTAVGTHAELVRARQPYYERILAEQAKREEWESYVQNISP